MTEQPLRPGSRLRMWYRPMRSRDRGEHHRVATPLELLFDLCFVVAVGQAAAQLHHALAEGHVGHGVFSFVLVFFGIWWGWLNFSWFASAFDTDDVPYRLVTLVQIAGGLTVAAGGGTRLRGRLPRDGRRLRPDAARDGRAVAASRAVGSRLPPGRPALRHRDRRLPGAVGGLPVAAARSAARRVLRVRDPGDGRPGLGGKPRGHHVAPAPHRRAVRPVHPDRARRGDPQRDERDQGGRRRSRGTSAP